MHVYNTGNDIIQSTQGLSVLAWFSALSPSFRLQLIDLFLVFASQSKFKLYICVVPKSQHLYITFAAAVVVEWR